MPHPYFGNIPVLSRGLHRFIPAITMAVRNIHSLIPAIAMLIVYILHALTIRYSSL